MVATGDAKANVIGNAIAIVRGKANAKTNVVAIAMVAIAVVAIAMVAPGNMVAIAMVATGDAKANVIGNAIAIVRGKANAKANVVAIAMVAIAVVAIAMVAVAMVAIAMVAIAMVRTDMVAITFAGMATTPAGMASLSSRGELSRRWTPPSKLLPCSCHCRSGNREGC